MANPRSLNLAPMPSFLGIARMDLDLYISKFISMCKANKIPKVDFLRNFPTTL